MAKKILIPFVLLLFVFSCKEETEIVDLYYDYFPIKSGTWIVYDVDSIAYNDFTHTTDTFNFQVKELITTDFVANEGRVTQRIDRYYKGVTDSVWQFKNVWISNRTEKTAERVEENFRFVKLIFPIAKSAKWNGNIANVYDEVKYEYKDVHVPYTINSTKLDSCLFVQHENELTMFSQKFAEEVYAIHIGKVYGKYIDLVTLADGTITSGYNYSYKATSWGN